MQEKRLAYFGTSFDKTFLPHLKGCVGGTTVVLNLRPITTLIEVKMFCKARDVTGIISNSVALLKKLLQWDKRKAPSLDNYVGSYFKLPGTEIEVVFIPPTKHLITVPYAKFITKRIVSKLVDPKKWFKPTKFSWELLDPATESKKFAKFSRCFLIAIDIETFRENATIRCISYTGFWYTSYFEVGGIESEKEKEIISESVVLPMDSEYNLAIMKKWNAKLGAPKVFANGKYDISYLTRYNAPIYNYIFDVQNLFHSWYSELPKSLGYLNSFFIREAVYWKDLAETNDLHEYYRYNALDTWGTGNVLLAMMGEIPKYAIDNYLLEFPLVFPCHLSEMTGINRDMKKLEEASKEQEAIIAGYSKSLDTLLGVKGFNTNSPIQMKALIKILGCSDIKNADEKALKKIRFRHPLNSRIISLVLKVRKARKCLSTYLNTGEKAKEFKRPDGTGSRILYTLNPHGTDSSRLASREHHFWCGLQVQNISRGREVKQTLCADPGFALAEVDLEQAESRDTAYISGEEAMIEKVETSADFHSANASAFFGVPFEKIFDAKTREVLNKGLRDLAKRVNHGANYNMGWYVLIDTMGEDKIIEARNLLELPKLWTLKEVASHLLEVFHETYPKIRSVFYKGVVEEIGRTKKLRSKALHLVGGVENEELENSRVWTRYCFSDPTKSKSALNSYISHPPQSLNAQTLNKAVLRVFNEIAVNPKHGKNFKLLAQIHDSILFQYRIGHYYLCEMVKDMMEIDIKIVGYDGKERKFMVPAGIKAGGVGDAGKGNAAKYWNELG